MRAIVVALLACALLAAQDSPKPMKVQVAAAPIKEQPRFTAKTLEIKKEGATVMRLGKVRAWSKIRWGESGVAYIPSSAVTAPKFFIPSSKAGSGEGDKAEATIAARGFNRDAEQKMSSEKGLKEQYALLDKIIVTPSWKRDWIALQTTIEIFMKNHHLGGPTAEGEEQR